MKTKKTTLHVTDREMNAISDYFNTKYPWICKGNTIYSASLVGMWEIKIGTEDAKEIEHLLKPCEINGFDFDN